MKECQFLRKLFLCLVDLVSGFNVASVGHDSKIDWLEVLLLIEHSPCSL